jgi:rhodanese-related sulfurtransferase
MGLFRVAWGGLWFFGYLHIANRYWTALAGKFTVWGMNFTRALTLAAWLLAGAVQAQQALPVNAQDAERLLARGAVALDVRSGPAYAQGHLPGAVSAPEALAAQDKAALQALVSSLGVDLSREVLVVGELGDARAMAFAAELSRYASGRVSWLVGGVPEWRMTGRSLSQQNQRLAAVPQFLTPLQSEPQQPSMAGRAMRDVVWMGPVVQAKLADSRRE